MMFPLSTPQPSRRLLSVTLAAALMSVSVAGALAAGAAGTEAAATPAAEAAPAAAAAADGAAGTDLAKMTFTKAQVVGGRLLYNRQCAACHGSDLQGGGGPELRGETMAYRVGRPVAELHTYIHEVMPADAPGTLSPAQVTTIIAYIASRNGFEPGGEALPSETEQLENIAFAQ